MPVAPRHLTFAQPWPSQELSMENFMGLCVCVGCKILCRMQSTGFVYLFGPQGRKNILSSWLAQPTIAWMDQAALSWTVLCERVEMRVCACARLTCPPDHWLAGRIFQMSKRIVVHSKSSGVRGGRCVFPRKNE